MKRRISVVAALEGLLIAGLLIAALIVPRHETTLSADAFFYEPSQQVNAQDGLITMGAMDRSSGYLDIAAYGIRLRPGAYEIQIDYDSDTDGRGDFYARGATFILDSNQDIVTDYINLNDSQTQVSGRAWVPLNRKGTIDAAAYVSYLGKGTVSLSGVKITENVGYRFVCILGLALFLALLHALHICLFSSEKKADAKTGLILLLAGIALIASLPIFVDFAYEGYDTSFHLKRIVTLAEEIKYGQFPVRMHTTANNGYGYPLSLYYGDFLLYLPAVLYNCAVPLQMCFQAYILLTNALTCVAAYYCLIRMTNHKTLSVMGSAMYVLSTYRLTNVYVRSAVGEYTAMIFIPLVILGMYLIWTEEKPDYEDWQPLSLGMAGVALSHILSTEMLAFDLALLCLCFVRHMLSKNRILAIVKAAALCIVLSGWFLVPFVDCFLNQSVIVQKTSQHIQERGTYIIQLFSIFTTGFGGNAYSGLGNRMPLTIGASLVAGVAAILSCLQNRHRWQLTQTACFRWIRALVIIGMINLLMTLACFPWDSIQEALGRFGGVIASMQFPWRWLIMATTFLIFGTVFALQLMEKQDQRLYSAFFASILIGIIIGTGYFYFRFINEVPIYPSYFKNAYEGSDELYYLVNTDTEAIRYPVCEVEEGTVRIDSYEKSKGIARLTVDNDASKDALVAVPVFAYRGYRAYSESGEELAVVTGSNNRIAVCVPAKYSGEIEIRFVPPMHWRIAEVGSLAAVVFILAMQVKKKRKRSIASK